MKRTRRIPIVWQDVVQLKRPEEVNGEAAASVTVEMTDGDALAHRDARTIG